MFSLGECTAGDSDRFRGLCGPADADLWSGAGADVPGVGVVTGGGEDGGGLMGDGGAGGGEAKSAARISGVEREDMGTSVGVGEGCDCGSGGVCGRGGLWRCGKLCTDGGLCAWGVSPRGGGTGDRGGCVNIGTGAC